MLARINDDPDDYTPFVVQMGTMGVAVLLTVAETALVISGLRSFRSLNEKEKKYIVALRDDFNAELRDTERNAVSRAPPPFSLLSVIHSISSK